mgnify:CR=1 FL=1
MSSEMRPCNVSLQIQYTNSKNVSTLRIVDVKTYSTDSNGFMRAYCHHRRTMRSFKYANVNECTDVLTGEVITPVELLTYFNAVYAIDPARELDAFLFEHKPIIDVFSYMMQVDGKVAPSERRVILEWVFEQSFLSETFMDYCDRILQAWAPPQDERQYLITLQQVNKLFPELTEEIYQYSKAIMQADRKIHEAELVALGQMKRIFGLSEE